MTKKTLLLASLLAIPAAARAEAPSPYKGGENILAIWLGGANSANEFEWSQNGGRDERAGDPGGTFGGQWMRFVKANPAIALGVDANLAGLSEHEADGALPNLRTESRFTTFTLMPMARIGRTGGWVRPYGFAGLGLHTTRLQLEATPIAAGWSDNGGTEKRTIVDGTGTGLAVAFGGGVDVPLNDQFFLGGELRVSYLGHANYGVEDRGRSVNFEEAKGDLSISSLAVRFGMRF